MSSQVFGCGHLGVIWLASLHNSEMLHGPVIGPTAEPKGILLKRQSGFEPASDPEIKTKFEELEYLQKSIGKTGKLAILPFLRTSSRDLWQLYLIDK